MSVDGAPNGRTQDQSTDGRGRSAGGESVTAEGGPRASLPDASSRNPKETESARISKLMDDINTHLETQTQRWDEFGGLVQRLADHVADLTAQSSDSAGRLSRIGESAAAGAASLKRVEEGLLQLPQLSDAQREALVSIVGHLEASREMNEKLASTLAELQQAVYRLNRASEESIETLQLIRSDALGRDKRVTSLLEAQTSRLGGVLWAILTLGGIAAILGMLAILR